LNAEFASRSATPPLPIFLRTPIKYFRFFLINYLIASDWGRGRANTVFSDFEGNSLNFVKNWLKETGMEKQCTSFEGMYYKIV
jgi:hypothetical protein